MLKTWIIRLLLLLSHYETVRNIDVGRLSTHDNDYLDNLEEASKVMTENDI